MLQLVQTPKWPQLTFTHDGWSQKIELDGKQISFAEISQKLAACSVELPATAETLEDFAQNIKIPDGATGVHFGTCYLDELLQAHLEQLKYYLAELPEEITPFVTITHTEGLSLARFMALLGTLSFSPFQLIVRSPWIKKFPYAFAVIGQGTPFDGACSKRLEQALLIPESSDSCYFEELATFLQNCQGPMRVINEREFIYAWDGVEKLYVLKESLSKIGQRALNGFIATGGEVQSVSM